MSDPASADQGSDTGEIEARPRHSPLVFLPLVVFVALIVLLAVRLLSGQDASLVPSALIGKPAPRFALQPPAGVDKPGLATADLAKGGVTVVNVFASWCVPCRSEAPQLAALQAKGVPLVGIAYKDKPQDTRRFLNQLGDPYTRIGADEDGHVGIDFGVYGVPETYVVDGDGIIQAKIVGPLTDDNIASTLMPAIAKAHDAKPADKPVAKPPA